MLGATIVSTVKSNTITLRGFEYSVTLQDSGIPVDWWINGVHNVVRTDSNEKSAITVLYVQDATGTLVSKVGRKAAIEISYICVPFASFDDNVWYYNTRCYDIIKYSSNISHIFNMGMWCTEMYNLAKDVGSGNVVMAIPKVYANVSVEAMEYIFQSDYIKKRTAIMAMGM